MVPRKCQPTLAYSASAIWGPNAFRLARAVQVIFGLLGKEQLLVIRRDRFQHCMLFFTTSSGNHSTGSQNLEHQRNHEPSRRKSRTATLQRSPNVPWISCSLRNISEHSIQATISLSPSRLAQGPGSCGSRFSIG